VLGREVEVADKGSVELFVVRVGEVEEETETSPQEFRVDVDGDGIRIWGGPSVDLDRRAIEYKG
jgi:predicted lipoprotein